MKEKKLMDLTNYITLYREEGKGKDDSKVFPLVVRGGILSREIKRLRRAVSLIWFLDRWTLK